ncbi:sulfate transporter, putative [Ricinus communis]|uniref:Sulfate transporter, putative n=1 Tax=Ricinus communis TaxID=3988 RepID=B9TAM8_RICCO|nr:sulfate transporter, putative [Ricinus communis]
MYGSARVRIAVRRSTAMAVGQHAWSLRNRVPSIGWLKNYRREWLRPDIVAGLTAAAVVIPKAMAYATIAGLPVEVGLYTVFVPMVIYMVLGTSRPLSVSTTTTIAILAASAMHEIAPIATAGELLASTATLSLLVGLILILAFVLRLGFLANFISEPVLTGFKSGIALVIVLDQLPKLLGVHITKTGFFRDVWQIVEHLPQISLPTFVLALVILVLIFSLEKFLPRAPAPLLAVALGIAATALLGLDQLGVATVGHIERGLPSLIAPRTGLFAHLWPAAVGIALMSFTESIAAARAFAVAGEPRPQPNQELLALGLANAAGAIIGAMPAGGGTTQTAVNRKAGARTQLAELVTALGAAATLVFLAPLIALMPHAVLAAVVIAYSVDLISPRDFREILRVRRTEFFWALIAFLGVVFLGTLRGILVAVLASLIGLMHQAYNPPMYVLGRKRGSDVFRERSVERADDETWSGLLIVRVVGRAFFANASGIGERMLALMNEHKPKVLLLDCRALFDIEYTALKMLGEAEERARNDGVMLWLAGMEPEVAAMVRRSSLGETLGRERIFPTPADAQMLCAHAHEKSAQQMRDKTRNHSDDDDGDQIGDGPEHLLADRQQLPSQKPVHFLAPWARVREQLQYESQQQVEAEQRQQPAESIDQQSHQHQQAGGIDREGAAERAREAGRAHHAAAVLALVNFADDALQSVHRIFCGGLQRRAGRLVDIGGGDREQGHAVDVDGHALRDDVRADFARRAAFELILQAKCGTFGALGRRVAKDRRAKHEDGAIGHHQRCRRFLGTRARSVQQQRGE